MATSKKKEMEQQQQVQIAMPESLAAPSAAESAAQNKASAAAALANSSYRESDTVKAARQAVADYQAQKPAAYESQYQQRIDSLLEEILNREDFSYDFNADSLYQQYKDQYNRQAQLAMMDTLAAANGASGGYTNSYAVSAGSQSYQNELAKLNGILPELYNAALARYQQQGEDMNNRLAALNTQEAGARDAYEALLEDYYTELGLRTKAADTAYDRDYGQYQDALSALRNTRDYYAEQEKQALANAASQREYELALQKYQESVRQWEAEQAAAQAAAAAKQAQSTAKTTTSTAGSSSGSAASKAASSSSGSTAGKAASGSASSSASSSASASRMDSAEAAIRQTMASAPKLSSGYTAPSSTSQPAVVRTLLGRYVQSGALTQNEASLVALRFGVQY